MKKLKTSTFKCDLCQDTSWVPGENGFERCKCFQRELVERRWRKFGITPSKVKKINEYETKTEITKLAKAKAVQYIRNFNSIRLTDENSLAFLGQHGAGKSHLVIGIGAALVNGEDFISVVYMPYIEVMQELKANAMDEENYLKIQSKYTTAELLIVDDLFKDKVKKGALIGELKETDMKHIYPIINYRYINHLPTIYSSECDPDMLMDLDGALAGRILEPSSVVVFEKCKENDYRLRKFI